MTSRPRKSAAATQQSGSGRVAFAQGGLNEYSRASPLPL